MIDSMTIKMPIKVQSPITTALKPGKLNSSASAYDGAGCHIHNYKKSQSGFTLIEIMVVIVILAILAGLVVPKVVGQSDKARIKTTETALATVSNALDMYKIDNSRYPTTAQGLDALTTPPADAKNYPEGGYIKGGYPTDGWDNELQYVAPGSEGRVYDLFSLGADGQQGGDGQDADIYAQL